MLELRSPRDRAGTLSEVVIRTATLQALNMTAQMEFSLFLCVTPDDGCLFKTANDC